MNTKMITEFEIQYLNPIHDGYPAWPGGERWLCLYETDEGSQIVATRGLSDGGSRAHEIYLETTDEIDAEDFSSSWQGNLVYETARIIPKVHNLQERLQINTYLCLQINMDGAPLEWSLDNKNGNIGLFIGLQQNTAFNFLSDKITPLNIKLMRPQELLYSIQHDSEGRKRLAELYYQHGGTTVSYLDRKSVL